MKAEKVFVAMVTVMVASVYVASQTGPASPSYVNYSLQPPALVVVTQVSADHSSDPADSNATSSPGGSSHVWDTMTCEEWLMMVGPSWALTTAEAASYLAVAENSSAYQSFVAQNGPAHHAGSSPGSDYAISFSTAAGCANPRVISYDFNFIAGSNELAVGVDPTGTHIVSSLVVPAFTSEYHPR